MSTGLNEEMAQEQVLLHSGRIIEQLGGKVLIPPNRSM